MKIYEWLCWAAILVSFSFLLLFHCSRTHGTYARSNTTVFRVQLDGPDGRQVERRRTEGTSCDVDPDENRASAQINWCHQQPEVVTTESEERCPAGYVFADGFQDGRRLGNKFYDLAAGYCVARMTDRCLAINGSGNASDIENIFLFSDYIVHKEAPGPEYVNEFQEENDLVYDDRIKRLRLVSPEKAIVLKGYFQSFKYFKNGLQNMFKFRPEIKVLAERFLNETTPAMWKDVRFIRVGVHVRRGDYLEPENIEYGHTVPNESYFRKSIQYMIDKFRPDPIHIIVASEDPEWVEKNIHADMFNGSVEITISRNHSAGEDLAMLSSCEHLIQSTGTFGHFAAWLLTWNRLTSGNATIMYCSNFPRIGSELYSKYRKEDYYHPGWVGMEWKTNDGIERFIDQFVIFSCVNSAGV